MEEGFLGIFKVLDGLFAQSMFIILGMTCTGLGGFALYYTLGRQRGAEEVDGTLTGIRRHGKFYYAVYSYAFPDGETTEAMSDTGTTDTRGMETGRPVKILVRRDTPQVAHKPGGAVWPLIGLALLVAGLFMIFRVFTAYPVNGITWAIFIAYTLFSLRKLRRIMGTRRERQMLKEMRQQGWENLEMSEAMKLEDISPAEKRRQDMAGRAAGIIGVTFALLGVAGIIGALYLGGEKALLELDGARAEGKVTQLARGYTKGKNSREVYFPVVSFKDKDGKEHSFQDGAGANPAAFDEGDDVTVLYMPKDPADTATLDRGAEGWLAPGLLLLGGLLFLLYGISLLPRQRDEVK